MKQKLEIDELVKKLILTENENKKLENDKNTVNETLKRLKIDKDLKIQNIVKELEELRKEIEFYKNQNKGRFNKPKEKVQIIIQFFF